MNEAHLQQLLRELRSINGNTASTLSELSRLNQCLDKIVKLLASIDGKVTSPPL